MFPWNYGFHFGPGTYIFMGAFYTVLVVVVTTLLNALWRSHRDLSRGKVEHIRWHSDFHDLSAADRTCRHVLTGEFQSRECPNAFDCRECETHSKLVAIHPTVRKVLPDRLARGSCVREFNLVAATEAKRSAIARAA